MILSFQRRHWGALARVVPLSLLVMLSGCVSTAVDIVTLPVKVVGQVIETGVDAATTTQQEADEDRGKAMREAEEKAERERRKAEKQAKRDAARERDD